MSSNGYSEAQQARYSEIRKVTLIGSVIDLALGITKILVGLVAHSQALIADGVHSLSDLATDVLVLYAAKHSHKDADEEHPYGHGRIEALATITLGITLILVALGIAWEAVQRMNQPGLELRPGALALLIAFVSIVSKEAIYQYTVRTARRLRSDMLMANAWHSRSDAISSVVVLIGVAGAMYGYPYLDSVAAIAVAVMIAKIGVDQVRSSGAELIDTALEPGEVDTIRGQIFTIPGVRAVHMLRTRKSASDAFVDVHIQVDPRVSVSEGHQIGEQVRRQLIDKVDAVADVTVHIDPEDDEEGSQSERLPSREEILAHLKSRWPEIPHIAFDDLTLHYLSGELHIELVLPIDILESAEDAGRLVRRLKEAASDLPDLGDVQICFRP